MVVGALETVTHCQRNDSDVLAFCCSPHCESLGSMLGINDSGRPQVGLLPLSYTLRYTQMAEAPAISFAISLHQLQRLMLHQLSAQVGGVGAYTHFADHIECGWSLCDVNVMST